MNRFRFGPALAVLAMCISLFAVTGEAQITDPGFGVGGGGFRGVPLPGGSSVPFNGPPLGGGGDRTSPICSRTAICNCSFLPPVPWLGTYSTFALTLVIPQPCHPASNDELRNACRSRFTNIHLMGDQYFNEERTPYMALQEGLITCQLGAPAN